MSRLRCVPPSPDVIRSLWEQYLRVGEPLGLTFDQYLRVIGFTNPAEDRPGMDDGTMFRAVPAADGLELISVPSRAVTGRLRVMVLLVDFDDRRGTLPRDHYESLLFSKATHPTGSLRDYYDEVSLGNVDVTGEVHGWLRLPREYSYYTNGQSGTGDYPRNAQRMAEDAVETALREGVEFAPELDVLEQGAVTALFIVHAGIGAETQVGAAQRDNIWSHKWVMPTVRVDDGLVANRYLTVPNDARLGVCAHELGHLAFQWEDFYDPNYAQDGSAWDGSGDWDLMAGGSYNGDSRSPAHPIAWHKSQHGWIAFEEIRSSRRLVLDPFDATSGKAYKIVSPHYRAQQYLVLENRTRSGFDSYLPGEGLLVWRIDESKEMPAPYKPALQLVQADGRHDLERVGDGNAGDSGDPFPGSTGRTSLSDRGVISTSFPDGDDSRVEFKNIERNPHTGRITLDVEIDGVPVGDEPPPDEPEPGVVRGESQPGLAIPDAAPGGVDDVITLTGEGRVAGITVAVDIRHSYIGDLRVELVAPSGQRAVLHDRSGRNTRDLRRTWTAADTPSLAALAGAQIAGEWELRVSDHASRDTGTLDRWAIVIDVGDESRSVRERRTPALAIPDKDPTGVADAIRVGIAGIVRSIAVGCDITHTYVGDLRVELEGPGGERAVLHNMTGGGADDLKERWSSGDTAALAAFVGMSVRGEWVLRVSDHLGQDTGTLNEWTLEIDLASDARSVEVSGSPRLDIPDANAAGVASHLAVNEEGTVQSVEVEASITHTYVGDLRVELVAPSGERAVLHDRTGGNARNLELRLDSRESEKLRALVGQPLRGNWVLRVMDLEPWDEGTLERWGLTLTYGGATPAAKRTRRAARRALSES